MTAMERRRRVNELAWCAGLLALMGQWIVVHALGWHPAAPWEAILPGLGIFGAAFLLSWGAELAELEISQALALAFLALMAVLPEYAVDMYLAWQAAHDPSYTGYATANMTGANRLLIGVGWPVILLCYWLKTRRRQIVLDPKEQGTELATLIFATAYAFVIPLKRTLSIVDAVILVGLFVRYLIRSSRVAHAPPVLEGPPAQMARLPRPWRRLLTLALFLLPGYTIFIAAAPFANGLLHSARHFGVEEFLVIQWLAPLASESPEFIVAILFALRHKPQAGFGALVSSKVNQWTLLIGTLPLVYAISGGHLGAMPLDARQAEEIFLTAAQSLLAIVVLANWRFGLGEAALLLGLFATQLVVTATWARTAYAVGYVLLSAGYLLRRENRRALGSLLRRV